MYLLFLNSRAAKVEAKQLENSEIQTHPARQSKVTKIEVLGTVGGIRKDLESLSCGLVLTVCALRPETQERSDLNGRS